MHGHRVSRSLVLVVAATACSTATIEKSWHAPSGPKLTNVATLSPAANASTRQAEEDALAVQLSHHGVHAVPAYKIVGDRELGDRDHVAAVLTARGFDGVVTMRMVSATQRLELYPGRDPGYEDPWTRRPWGTVETMTDVRIEVNAYALPSKTLVWSASTRSDTPDGARGAINDMSQAVGDRLAADHVVASASTLTASR
jgi:hypothetical protein